MRKLGYIKSRATTADEVLDDLIINFNLQRADRQSMTYKDMQIIPTLSESAAVELDFFGILVFEYDDAVNEEKPQYIGMPAGVDPKRPETWQDLITSKKVWDKDRFDTTSVSLPETPGATGDEK